MYMMPAKHSKWGHLPHRSRPRHCRTDVLWMVVWWRYYTIQNNAAAAATAAPGENLVCWLAVKFGSVGKISSNWLNIFWTKYYYTIFIIYIVKLWRKIFVFYFKENSLLNLLDLHKLNSIPLYLFNNQLNKEILHIFLLYKEKDWTFIKCIMLTKLLIIQFNCMLVWQNKNT